MMTDGVASNDPVKTSEQQAVPVAQEVEPLSLRLAVAEVAACSCDTKTDDPRYHEGRCLYRVLRDARSEIDRLTALADKYFWQVRDTCTRAETAEAALASHPCKSGEGAGANPLVEALVYLNTLDPTRIMDDRGNPGLSYTGQQIVNAYKAGFAAAPRPDATQTREAEGEVPYVWRLDRSESESLFAALHGLTCGGQLTDIPDVMESVTDIFRSTMGGVGTRAKPLSDFESLAESINDSPTLMSVYAAPEWDELHDDGKQWVCALVRETMARCQQDYAAALNAEDVA